MSEVLAMNHVLTRVASVIAVTLGGWTTPGTVVAQDLGQLFVQVVNQAGAPVTDLSPAEFEVTEGDVVSKVVSAELDTQPMKIALLVDNSELIHQANALTSLRGGVDGFLTTLPARHEVALATIGQHIRWRVDFTTDREALRESAKEIFVDGGGGPILLDGIKETWERRFDETEPWPIFVVVATDGSESSGNMHQGQYERFVKELTANGVTVHVLLLSTRGGSLVTDSAINLTAHTGGLYEVFGVGTRLATALPEFAMKLGTHYEQISQRYRVVYERPDPALAGASLSIWVAREGVVAQGYMDRRIPQ
jgi:hypothetical protein